MTLTTTTPAAPALAAAPLPPALSWQARLARTARVQAWWGNKFSPVLATCYATACLLGVPAAPLLPRLLLLVAGLTVGATYVSVLNDWTDLADDLAAGKPNHLAARSPAFPALVLLACLALGGGLGYWLWQASPPAALCYLGSWVVFTAYSVPPLRLKLRGLAGVLADASGSHLFPQLLAVAAVAAWAGRPAPGLWYGAVGCWALACGVRNILYHQLEDVAADRAAGAGTWVVRRGPSFAQRAGQLVVFPLEGLAFGLLLTLSRQAAPLALLGVYLGLEAVKWRLWGQPARVLAPHTRILLNEYYEVFYPLAFLLVLIGRQPLDGLVLGAHLLLFGQGFWRAARFAAVVGWQATRKALGRLRSVS